MRFDSQITRKITALTAITCRRAYCTKPSFSTERRIYAQDYPRDRSLHSALGSRLRVRQGRQAVPRGLPLRQPPLRQEQLDLTSPIRRRAGWALTTSNCCRGDCFVGCEDPRRKKLTLVDKAHLTLCGFALKLSMFFREHDIVACDAQSFLALEL